jgi:hypothetical protein
VLAVDVQFYSEMYSDLNLKTERMLVQGDAPMIILKVSGLPVLYGSIR